MNSSAAFTNRIHVGVGKYLKNGKLPEEASSLFMQASWVLTDLIILIPSDSAAMLGSKQPSLVSRAMHDIAESHLRTCKQIEFQSFI